MRVLMFVLATVLLLSSASAGAGQRLDANEPVSLAGAAYYPSGPTVFFDGGVMVRAGSYKGVPVYVDATRDPYNVVYVPIGGKLMRPYERRPVDRAADLVVPPPPESPDLLPAEEDLSSSPPEGDGLSLAAPPRPKPRPHVAADSRKPGDNRGIWIPFEDKIWVLADRQPYSARDLMPAGTYHGFQVYRDTAHPKQIFVASGADGFLARYTLGERQ